MNKQEVIERLNNKLDEVFAFQQSFKPLTWAHMECESKANAYMTAINYVEKLDEPQHDTTKKIPQIIAKYLELCKTDNFDFTEDYNLVSYDFINHFDTDLTIEEMEEIKMWFYDNDQKENQRRHILFLQAYTDGYEVEEEPKYYIRLTIPSSSVIGLYLGFNKDGKFDTSYGKPHITWGWKCRFTEKEIKAIDERYWPFAVPVEKVEE